MKEHVIVSVSTVEGSHHYQLGKWVQKLLKFLGYITLLGIISACVAIYYLLDEVDLFKLRHDELQVQSVALTEEISDLQTLKEALEQDLGQREERLLLVADRLSDLEQVLGVAPDGETELESRLDAAAITSTVRVLMLKQIPSGSPVGDIRVSSNYGYRTHPESGKRRLHRGMDYAVNTGTPIYSPADGVVEVVRPSNQGSGNFIRLQHSFGFSSSYSHMSKFSVKAGEFIEKGQLIGHSGNSGLSTGPHLHYEVRFVGRALDPKPFANWGVDNFETIFEKERGIRWDSLVKKVEQRVSSQLQLSSQKAVMSQDNSS